MAGMGLSLREENGSEDGGEAYVEAVDQDQRQGDGHGYDLEPAHPGTADFCQKVHVNFLVRALAGTPAK
jgi:hypothetical protein